MTYVHYHDGIQVIYNDTCPVCPEIIADDHNPALNGDNPNIIRGDN